MILQVLAYIKASVRGQIFQVNNQKKKSGKKKKVQLQVQSKQDTVKSKSTLSYKWRNVMRNTGVKQNQGSVEAENNDDEDGDGTEDEEDHQNKKN